MKKGLSFGIILIIAFLHACQPAETTQPDEAAEIANNQHLLMATAWYQQSAEMAACYYQAFYQAETALKNNLENDESDKPNAIVLDIDETLLDNSPFQAKMIETGKPYSSDFWKTWTDLGEADALPGAIEFLEKTKSMDVEIFYISNRKTNELDSSIENMETLGFPEIRREHFLFKEETSNKDARRAIVQADYDVLLYVGDNLNDYSNFLGDRQEDFGKSSLAENKEILGRDFIILPNPMYGNWEQALKAKYGGETQAEFLEKLKENLVSFDTE
ncbi:MAG: 5'-nucleotidase, lipoprotein e(P4) family [Bacteroidales bacterium]|nr:5'-nucleotidase, lipoprotein e(P4) family [Bacteroidales bacterium]